MEENVTRAKPMQPSPKIEFSGVLSRCAFSDGQAELRLTPFAFSSEARPVWSLVFSEPDFDAAALQPFLEEEVEIEVFAQHAVLYDVWQQPQRTLGCAKLATDQVSYDFADLSLHVRTLEAQINDLNSSLRTATKKNEQGRVILRELLRRAEIKAAASDHHRERQAAALEVLRRLSVHFDD